VVDGFEQIRFALLRPLVPRKKVESADTKADYKNNRGITRKNDRSVHKKCQTENETFNFFGRCKILQNLSEKTKQTCPLM
jgi:hypothetical protein